MPKRLNPIWALAAGLAAFAPVARSVCQVPQPRLVCAEFANSPAVIIAKVSGIRRVVDKDDFIEGYFYTLTTNTRLRGRIDDTFQVWEENSSGRASFGWTVGTSYLLFLTYYDGRSWTIDGCGNSGPLDRSADTLAAIKSAQSTKTARVEGMASTGSWTTGVPAVTINATGNGKMFTAQTDQRGQFQLRLLPGHYELKAVRPAWSFDRNPFSYENPNDLNLSAGGCAQVQFTGARK